MSHIIDIGGAPAEEECAQLGQTIDFEAANLAEVMAYKLAIIARHGSTVSIAPSAGRNAARCWSRYETGVS